VSPSFDVSKPIRIRIDRALTPWEWLRVRVFRRSDPRVIFTGYVEAWPSE
jgi:hypothetical protein